MVNFEQWNGFDGSLWKEEVNVRDFIQKNYKPYDGDEHFLAGPTDATNKLWGVLQGLQKEERAKGGVLDMDTEIVSGITAHEPGYISEDLKDLEAVVGLQTDKPLKRAFMPYGGIKMAEQACSTYGYEPDPELHKIFTEYCKTHNQGVFDAYTPEMKKARHNKIITGLPDTYGRGRIVGDYRRVALYGIDFLIEQKKEDFANCGSGSMTDDIIRQREELAEQIAANVLDPEVMKSIFLQADEWEIDAFDHASTRKCFLATHKDWKELEWFSNKGYIVAYSDNHAEVPQEVIAVYNQINTPELQEKCRQLSWMRSCQSMMGLIYAIAPLKIVYRMYRKRDGFRVNYEKFMEILNELSEKDDICIIKGDKMIWKAVLQDNLYEKIEEFQGDRDFYIPTVEETLDYAKHGYPSQDVSYRKLASFLRDELHISEEKIEELLYIVYKEFSMDGMLSDIMEEFKKRDIVFESDRQMERFAPIMMEVNNNTRMLDFRGYTPNEVSRVEQAAAPAPVAPAMPSFVPMANTPAVNMQPKKKVYPNDPCPCGSGKKYKKCCGRN